MRKISTLASSLSVLVMTSPVFANSGDRIDAGIDSSKLVGRAVNPDTTIGDLVSFGVTAVIVFAFLAALMYIVLGAFQWITSGGDKTKVADARNHIIAAIIGLIVISLSFVIINVVLQALGLGNLSNLNIPTITEFSGNP